jgi:hypothetical protein
VDSAVGPTGIVARKTQDEGSDAADGGRPARSCGARDPSVAVAQKVAVPAQDGVGRDDQGEPSQRWSGELEEQGSEKRPVGQGEPRLVDPALQDGELVARHQDLDIFVGVTHGQ